MSRIALSRGAIDDLDSLIASHSLPDDTPARVARSLAWGLAFPARGRAADGTLARLSLRARALALDGDRLSL